MEYSQVICTNYAGNLPFTGILREVYGLLYSRSTSESIFHLIRPEKVVCEEEK